MHRTPNTPFGGILFQKKTPAFRPAKCVKNLEPLSGFEPLTC